jgi:hypothetical protein
MKRGGFLKRRKALNAVSTNPRQKELRNTQDAVNAMIRDDTAWDGPAEVKTCGDDLKKLKAICAWFDSENADVKSSYKLPHHEANGLKAVWKGVSAAGNALMGSRGGVDIPDKDVAAVKAHLQ